MTWYYQYEHNPSSATPPIRMFVDGKTLRHTQLERHFRVYGCADPLFGFVFMWEANASVGLCSETKAFHQVESGFSGSVS